MSTATKVRHRPLARGDACSACKTRKVRCPGERPSCANCTKHSRSCIYSHPQAASPPTPPTQSSSSTSIPTPNPTIHPISKPNIPYLTPQNTLINPQFYTNPLSQSSHPYSSGYPHDTTIPDYASPPNVADSTGQMLGYMNTNQGVLSGLLPYWEEGDMGGQTMPSGWEEMDWSFLNTMVEQGEQEEEKKEKVVDQGELTAQEQEHLLWLYFSNQRIFGLEVHVASFYRDLHSETIAKRPHECLILAMCLVALPASQLTALRSRQTILFRRASKALDDALEFDMNQPSETRKVFDACRAATLLASALYNSGQYTSGWIMTGKAVNAAIACGLDIIPSSLYREKYPQRLFRRQPATHLDYPQSQLDLAERIYAFWAIFLVNRVAALSHDWPAGFHLERVITPLPRPWAEYERGDAHLSTCDDQIQNLLSGRVPKCEHPTDFGRHIKAVILMYQTSLLALPVPFITTTGRIDMAPAFTRAIGRPDVDRDMLENALKVFVNGLPEELKGVKVEHGKVVVNARTATLQFITGAAEMNLYDNDSYKGGNERALVTVRRLLGVMHLLGDAEIGDVSLFVVIIWTMMARLLMREYKRLSQIGESFAAASINAEFNFIQNAMVKLGGKIELARILAEDLSTWLGRARSDVGEDDGAEEI